MALEDVARRAGVDPACIKLIAKWEGCLKRVGPDQYAAYLCPARVATIGYGTTVYNEVGRPVRIGDATITRARAEELLAFDIGKKYAPAVDRAFNKWQTENQRSACVSFAYNVGTHGFAKSTLCFLLKQGQHKRAADEFMKWTRGGGRTLPGLVNRRRDERALFLAPGGAPRGSAPLPAEVTAEGNAPPLSGFQRFMRWLRRE